MCELQFLWKLNIATFMERMAITIDSEGLGLERPEVCNSRLF
jgi:hypothetical protein